MTARWSDSRRLGGLLLVLALGCLLPALALPDATLADSLTFRIKVRILGPFGVFDPASTELINPYYRPLFILLSAATDAISGDSDLGLRLMALVCHALAGVLLFRLARVLRLPDATALAGVLLFLIAPGNVFTAAWPVVAYWSLAAAMAFACTAHVVLYVAGRGRGHLVAALVWQAASLLVSQTGYHFVALGPWLLLCPPLPPTIGGRTRAAIVWAGLSALAVLHFGLLEAAAQGLAPETTLTRLAITLRGSLGYWEGTLGGDFLVGHGWIFVTVLALVLAGTLTSSRPVWFLAGFAFVATLPFAAFGVSERYAYFASGPLCLWTAWSLLQGWPRLVGAGRWIGRVAMVGLIVVLGRQSLLRLADIREASQQTGTYVADLRTLHSELPDLSRVAFVNLPPMLKWNLNDVWDVRHEEDLILVHGNVEVGPRNIAAFATRTHYFGPAELRSQGFESVVHCDGGHLIRRSPDRPLGDREAVLEPWFLARELEVVARTGELRRGALGEQDYRDHMAARLAALGDPRDQVLIEAPVEGLSAPLPDGPADFELHIDPDLVAAGLRFPGRLQVRTDLPRPGLLVVITWFGAEDPVHRIGGDIGRFCSQFEALVDDQPVEVVPVFYHCVGVVVPAGPHTVQVRPKTRGGPPHVAGS